MTADIVFSLMLSQLSELIPHTKRITFETLPKPLSAVPHVIKNTKKSGVALPRNLSSGLSASRSWFIVMSFRDRHHRRHHQHMGSLLGMTS